MRTIIQHIGPLYGEKNTGTVFGQPNGSIAVTASQEGTVSSDQIWKLATQETIDDVAVTFNGIRTITSGSNYAVVGRFTKSGGSTVEIENFLTLALLQDISDTTLVMRLVFSPNSDLSSPQLLLSYKAGNYTTISSSIKTTSPFSYSTYYIGVQLYDSAGNYLEKYSNIITAKRVA